MWRALKGCVGLAESRAWGEVRKHYIEFRRAFAVTVRKHPEQMQRLSETGYYFTTDVSYSELSRFLHWFLEISKGYSSFHKSPTPGRIVCTVVRAWEVTG